MSTVEKERLWFVINLVILGLLSVITSPLWCSVSCALFDLLLISDLFFIIILIKTSFIQPQDQGRV